MKEVNLSNRVATGEFIAFSIVGVLLDSAVEIISEVDAGMTETLNNLLDEIEERLFAAKTVVLGMFSEE